MSKYRIRDLNKDEKPRERLQRFGVKNLSNEELLAIILRSGGKEESAIELARNLLKKWDGIKKLSEVDVNQLCLFKNINLAKASSIVAAIEFGYRTYNIDETDNITIKSPADVYKCVRRDIVRKQKEYLYMLSLNTRNKVLFKDLISVGTINETLLSPREIFKQALTRNAVSIILVHNHPSQETTPSIEDLEATKKVAEVGKTIGINLVDHIIVDDNSFLSMKNQDLVQFN